eukprot:TRINITY_DN32246_c0_g1_i1.p1 TRINITY_DN32246_c0_g1~~TRINITY_DN32246_c0_g1_i1.p1  ORF type:complete len:357 (+),score=135.29 TRINITY_DN32246_c0_g1_i1:70-1071(+)
MAAAEAPLPAPRPPPPKHEPAQWHAFLDGPGLEVFSALHAAQRPEGASVGLPADMRAELWPRLCSVDSYRKAYSSRVWLRAREGVGLDKSVINKIEKDVHRAFPSHPFFQDKRGQDSLLHVLVATAAFDPKLAYTQGMGFVAGMFLLHGVSEEETFWCMVALSHDDKWAMRGVWAPELDDSGIWSEKLRGVWDLLRKISPSFAAWSEAADAQAVDMLFLSFVPSFFCNRLPLLEAARVVDAFLIVGWSAFDSLLVTLMIRAWRVLNPAELDSAAPTGQPIPLLLPLMCDACRDAPAAVARDAWWVLLHPDLATPPTADARKSLKALADAYEII